MSTTESRMLTKQVAERWLQEGAPFLFLSEYTGIEPAAAKVLSESGEHDLVLDGLTTLSPESAKHLAEWHSPAGSEVLHLNGLKEFSIATAQALSNCVAPFVELDGLLTISEEVAEALSNMANSAQLSLNGVRALTDRAAVAIARFPGAVLLEGITDLPDSVIEAFGRRKESFSLNGLMTLTSNAARFLSQHENDLWLDGLTSLTDDEAAILSQHKGGTMSLQGLTSLSETAAKCLSSYRGNLMISVANSPQANLVFMEHPDSEVRKSAVKSMRASPDFSQAMILALVCRLQDNDLHIREIAAESLVDGRNPVAIPSLLDALQSAHNSTMIYTVLRALSSFTELPTGCLRLVAEQLESSNQWIRISACDVLGHMGVAAKCKLLQLEQLAERSDGKTKVHALRAIRNIKQVVQDEAGHTG